MGRRAAPYQLEGEMSSIGPSKALQHAPDYRISHPVPLSPPLSKPKLELTRIKLE